MKLDLRQILIHPVSTANRIQGGFDFSVWIFDIEIEKMRAEIFFYHIETTKIMLGKQGKFLEDSLRPTFYNFVFTFPESAFHDFSLAPHQKIDFSAK
jgi:hypothetical protein